MAIVALYWGPDIVIAGDAEGTEKRAWKRGHIIEVLEDDQAPEPVAPTAKLALIRLPGISVDALKRYMLSRDEDWIREYIIDVDILPQVIKDKLTTDKEMTLAATTISEVKGWVRNRKTNLLEG